MCKVQNNATFNTVGTASLLYRLLSPVTIHRHTIVAAAAAKQTILLFTLDSNLNTRLMPVGCATHSDSAYCLSAKMNKTEIYKKQTCHHKSKTNQNDNKGTLTLCCLLFVSVSCVCVHFDMNHQLIVSFFHLPNVAVRSLSLVMKSLGAFGC